MHVGIIGAGISGLLSAWYLLQSGHKVTVIEAADHVASKASGANGAQLSWSYVNPIGQPSLIKHALPFLLGSNPAFALQRHDIETYKFCLKLLTQSTTSQFNNNRDALLDLSVQSKVLYEMLLDEEALGAEPISKGKLHLHNKKEALKAQKEFEKTTFARGLPQVEWGEAHCRAFADRFCEKYDDLYGGIYAEEDVVADCQKFCISLLKHMKQNDNFSVRFSTYAEEFTQTAGQLESITTNHGGVISADAWLFCTGSATNRVLKPLGIKVPVYPIKGYSIDIPVSNVSQLLPVSITDHSLKMVFVPMEDEIRVSGCFQFAGHDTQIDPKTLDYMYFAIRKRLGNLDFSNADIKVGLRPCTPSSLPIIGKTKVPNVFLNTGHGMLGWTLSFASAHRAASIIAENFQK